MSKLKAYKCDCCQEEIVDYDDDDKPKGVAISIKGENSWYMSDVCRVCIDALKEEYTNDQPRPPEPSDKTDSDGSDRARGIGEIAEEELPTNPNDC